MSITIPTLNLEPPPNSDSADSNTTQLTPPESHAPQAHPAHYRYPLEGPDEARHDDSSLKPSGTSSDGDSSENPLLNSSFIADPSSAIGRTKEQRLKDKVIGQLMGLIGLDTVKDNFKAIEDEIALNRRLGVNMKQGQFHAIFQGNPGTGKTTVARLYAKFLYSMGIVTSRRFIETSGTKLASMGPSNIMQIFGLRTSNSSSEPSDSSDNGSVAPSRRRNRRKSGGVLFVDEAFQLVAPHAGSSGKQILDVILTEMENSSGSWVVIFAGYKSELELFLAHNAGLQSRIQYYMDFDDFNDTQLREILVRLIKESYDSKMKIECGTDGIYMKAAIYRLSRGRGKQGFGNARAVETLLSTIKKRYVQRLRGAGSISTDQLFFLTKEDIIGPPPSSVKDRSDAWVRLQALVGLEEVKSSVENMFAMVQENYYRELDGKKPFDVPLNRIFVGSPGTGKTTVAKLYGKILVDLGFLSNGDVVIKKPVDFIGRAVGESEANSKAILASTLGKVLIIDEACMLDPGDPAGTQESFKTAILDTLVAEIQGVPGDDRCVILLGYEDKINRMFQNANEGLTGRFMADRPFRFTDYRIEELDMMLQRYIKEHDLTFADNAKEAAMGVLSRSKKKSIFQQRKGRGIKSASSGVLHPEDFDPTFNRRNISSFNIRVDLEGKVSNEIIQELEVYGRILRSGIKDPFDHIPTSFILKGPTGTGKSTLARYLGKMFYDMGFLLHDTVIECWAADLVGQHVGHTAPKTRAQFLKGLGKVLIVHDFHRLKDCGYNNEAIDELVSLIPQYHGGMVIVLIGQGDKINQLMRDRPDLERLFPKKLTFKNLGLLDSLAILETELQANGMKSTWSSSKDVRKGLSILISLPGWSNVKDIKALVSRMIQNAYRVEEPDIFKDEAGNMCIPEHVALSCIREVFIERCIPHKHNKESSPNSSSKAEVKHEVRREHAHKQQHSEKEDKSRSVQEVLQNSRCEAGYAWRREGCGYRCEAGSHYISDAEIEAKR
ncbi:P-loop containing nucleoside triphosphate hydrolase protein [Daldinia vernicosa]|uniref:P-loop containing nucleoside triphosphate hydrolase protein n=1 Tax=Daldinia vernicosa TaxID=114800 RepID=UPI00200765FC|nr:P-loop containing nucleoside triphosphate hydrolase protein [Daldinia vernicosa]KAI0852336.1 P-loop containing nucleoside triphosphate hydrolase protein [Daldinia vernicosa]